VHICNNPAVFIYADSVWEILLAQCSAHLQVGTGLDLECQPKWCHFRGKQMPA
jgi:hypothetical protein